MCGTNVSLYFEGDVATHGASDQTHEKTRVDSVDFSPPDPNQHQIPINVTNLRPVISLVKSKGCD